MIPYGFEKPNTGYGTVIWDTVFHYGPVLCDILMDQRETFGSFGESSRVRIPLL